MTGQSTLADAAARQQIATDLDTSIVCLAGAGAGKTQALIERMVASIGHGTVDIAQMAAITFTRKAAGQMRGRFLLAMQHAVDQGSGEDGDDARQLLRLRDGVARVDQCQIGTIHAFCARLLRERPIEAGLPPDFTEVEEREELFLVRDAWDRFLQERSAAGDQRLLDIEETGLSAEQFYQFYLDRCQFSDLELKPTLQQRPNLEPAVSQVCQLISDVEPLIPDPLPEGRPDRLMETLRELRHFVDFSGPPSDVDRERLLRDMATTARTRVTLKCWGSKGSAEQTLARRLRDEVLPTLANDLLKPLLGQWRRYVYTLAGSLVDDAMESYRLRRLRAATLTFNDLLELTARLLRDNPEVRRYLASRYRRLLVDEFQDTDPLQAEILLRLSAPEDEEQDWRKLSPEPGRLFLVGDEKQSIYRFRRADLDVFRLTTDRVRHAGGKTVELTTCFRSRPDITRWINHSFEPLFDNDDPRHQAPFRRLVAHRERVDGAGVYQLRAGNEATGRRQDQVAEEADRIAAFIAAALRGATQLNGEHAVLGRRAQPGDFLLLTRTRRYLTVYARALERAGVAYDVTGAGSLHDSAELRALVDALDVLFYADDPVPMLAYLRGPLLGLGDDELYRLRKAGWRFLLTEEIPDSVDGMSAAVTQRLQAAIRHLRLLEQDLQQRPPAAALERFLEQTGYAALVAAGEAGASRAGNLLRVLAIVRDAQNRRGLGWAEVAAELRDLLQEDRQRVEEMTLDTGREDVVRVMNLHQAKGLEAPVVFLADPLDTSAQQHAVDMHVSRTAHRPYLSMAVTRRTRYQTLTLAEPDGWPQDADEEERFVQAEMLRLVYVAATRARDVLVISTTGQRKGAWSALEPALSEAPDLPAPASVVSPRASQEELFDVARLRDELQQQRAAVARASYELRTVTDDGADPKPVSPATRGRGRPYGTAIHRLFDHAVRGRMDGWGDGEESDFVRVLLAEEGLTQQADIEAAHRALHGLRASKIWAACRQATAQTQTEVPLGVAQGATIHRGVIDLVYRVSGGWAIVDYKTHAELDDRLTQGFTRQLNSYAEHWKAASGEPVVEQGIWLASSDGRDRYIALS